MPIISTVGTYTPFTGGTVSSATTFTGQETVAANLPGDTALYVKNTDPVGNPATALSAADKFDSNIFAVNADNVNEVASGVQVNGTLNVTSLTNTSRLVSLAQTNGKAVAVGKSGELIINLNTVPADADLAANDLSLWFDSTNGAAKLMIKAKQADGSVKTGSVSLA